MKRILRITAAVIALAAVAAIAAGCGGAGKKGPVPPDNSAGGTATQKTPPPGLLRAAKATAGEKTKTCPSPSKPWEDSPLGHPCDVQGVQTDYPVAGAYKWYFYNNTPYTMKLNPIDTAAQYYHGHGDWPANYDRIPGHNDWIFALWFDHAPPQTLLPGQSVPMYEYNCYGSSWVSYTYTATGDGGDGKQHMITFGAHLGDLRFGTKCGTPVSGFATTWDGSKWVFDEGDHKFAESRDQPNAPANSLGVFLNDPKQIDIDAATDAGRAQTALAHLNDSGRITDESFTLDKDNGVSAADGQLPQAASPTLINQTSSDAEVVTAQSGTSEESTTLSEGLSVEAEGGLLGKVKAGFEAESKQTWKTSDSWETEESTEVPGIEADHPTGTQGCLAKQVAIRTVTGTVKFKWWGIPFVITHAQFSSPAGGKGNTIVTGWHANFPDDGKDFDDHDQKPFPCTSVDPSQIAKKGAKR